MDEPTVAGDAVDATASESLCPWRRAPRGPQVAFSASRT